MSAANRLRRLLRAARLRAAAIHLACAAPPLAALAWVAVRAGWLSLVPALALAFALALALAFRAWRRVDALWLARRLDRLAPQMEDSAALLFRDEGELGPLARLQQARLRARLETLRVDPRAPWPRALLALSLATALLLALGARWIARNEAAADARPRATSPRAAASELARAELEIRPPAYTGLPLRRVDALDAAAPEGSKIEWRLGLRPRPAGVTLEFHDGSRLELDSADGLWRGERELASSLLYRLRPAGAPPLADDRLFRLDAVPDRPPRLRILAPQHASSEYDPARSQWHFEAEAEDDYGLGGALLEWTLAAGSGEAIAFSESSLELATENTDGAAPPRRARYRHDFDPAALGMQPGSELIVHLTVRDRREAQANATRSAAWILRWPDAAAAAEEGGLEGVVQRALPAWFRSQRQIIIDSEALAAAREELEPARLLARSDAIGVDQKLLRLRYGEFLGEEFEGRDADPGGDQHEAEAAQGFGRSGEVAVEFGHVHDVAEAATLFDPQAREVLRAALGAMWQAELELRQGRPEDALPHEHRALEKIKQLQQAERIYLARVGLELPTPDEARRLSGERAGLVDPPDPLRAAEPADARAARLWRALDAPGEPDWEALQREIGQDRAALPGAIELLLALDAARRDPACADCRGRLRALLWPLLPLPAAALAPRAAADAQGRAWRERLEARP